MMRKLSIGLTLLGALGGLFPQAAAAQTLNIEVGQPFPDLELPRLQDGRPASIRDFRGEKLILHVWASW